MDAQGAPLMLSVSGARGIVGKTMTAEVAAAYGAAFGSFLRSTTGKARPRVVVGLDGRISGPPLAAAAIGGLTATGCDVIDIGVAMTPTVGVMIGHHRADGGLTVTASHNPIEWNGIKCLDGNGLAPPPAIAKEIVDRFRERRIDWCGPLQTGRVERDGGAARVHVDRVLANVDVASIRARTFTVVLDSVNGSGCTGGRMLLEELGCRVEHIFGEPTGIFGHVPEPLVENLVDLANATRNAKGAACGFAQDPDADRLAIVDEAGRFIGEECTLVLAALRMLQRTGGGALAANLSTSRMIDDVAARFSGSHVVRTAVGEANVVAGLRPANGILGGEGNGGVIFPPVCWVRDSLSAMALVLELLAHEGKTLSQLVAALPRYAMVKRKMELAAVGGMAAVAPALAKVKAAFANERVSDVDGVRIDFADGWVHLRASNTEPIVRVIAEAPDAARANALCDACARAAGI
ncbi:MAG: phosphoglucosamine mutase [Phycisphaerales bacterium]|nr:phosphoglucosamine mutase [Phycisphaerales bacterium]